MPCKFKAMTFFPVALPISGGRPPDGGAISGVFPQKTAFLSGFPSPVSDKIGVTRGVKK